MFYELLHVCAWDFCIKRKCARTCSLHRPLVVCHLSDKDAHWGRSCGGITSEGKNFRIQEWDEYKREGRGCSLGLTDKFRSVLMGWIYAHRWIGPVGGRWGGEKGRVFTQCESVQTRGYRKCQGWPRYLDARSSLYSLSLQKGQTPKHLDVCSLYQ